MFFPSHQYKEICEGYVKCMNFKYDLIKYGHHNVSCRLSKKTSCHLISLESLADLPLTFLKQSEKTVGVQILDEVMIHWLLLPRFIKINREQYGSIEKLREITAGIPSVLKFTGEFLDNFNSRRKDQSQLSSHTRLFF